MELQRELESEGNWLFKHRSYLPIAILAVGTIVYLATIHRQGYLFSILLPHWTGYEFACLSVGLLGVCIRAYTVGHSPSGTSGRNTERQVAETLNTTGVYSIVRHPLYLGNFLMWFSICLLTCNIGFITTFLLFYWLYYERIMYAEEQFLHRKFGNTYLHWASHTPAFIPSLKRFVPPKISFSWRKVLKKEKNGVFALTLIFCCFDAIGASQNDTIDLNWILLSSAIASGIAYVLLEYFKKRTHLLDESRR